MCGIFGMIYYGNSNHLVYYETLQLRETLKSLLEFSEERGTDASGLCIVTDIMSHIFKDKERGSKLKESYALGEILLEITPHQKFRCAFGHTRAQTKGTYLKNENNHPIVANKTIGVHNGIIFNDDSLFTAYDDDIEREGLVDSEIIFRLIDMYICDGKSIVSAVKETTKQLDGSYACAFTNLDCPHYITLFKGSTYPSICIHKFDSFDMIVFASTASIIDKAVTKNKFYNVNVEKYELSDAQGVRINTINGKMYCFDLEKKPQNALAVNSYHQYHQGVPCSECQETDCDKCRQFAFGF